MQTDSAGAVFKVLSTDSLIYGPINLATLIQWVRERRVHRDSWVYWELENKWVAAGLMDSLRLEFKALSASPLAAPDSDSSAVTVDELRQFERFSPYSNEELELLISFSEVVEMEKGDVIIKKDDLSDALFIVLSGKVRARIKVSGYETTLGTMHPGELFGEVAMLSQTARSADVVAEEPSRLLRVTSDTFQQLMSDHPPLAARLLYNIARLLASRLAERNVNLQKDLAASFVWR